MTAPMASWPLSFGMSQSCANNIPRFALGAGLPGIIDGLNGRVRELSNVPGWRDVPLAALLREKTGLPSIIENDANAMAYAEWRFGAGRDRPNVICMTLGTGVGGGLILDGNYFAAASSAPARSAK